MRFALSDDQLMFRDAVRVLLADHAGPAAIRASWAPDGSGRVGDVWRRLTDMGVVAMRAPEASGGMGMDDIDLVAIQEEAGFAALAEPLIEHVAVGIPALAEAGDAAEALLAAAVDGSSRLSAVIGSDAYAPQGRSTDVFLIEVDSELLAVARDAATLTPQPSVDESRHLVTVEVSGTDSSVVRLGGAEALAAAADRGALASAAQLVGVTRRLIETTTDYAKERHQFGKPIGVNQAVKHQLADARVALEFAQPLVLRAATSLAGADPDRSTHVSMAKAQASEAGDLAARVALQMHGAIGYTFEYDLHLWLKRAWTLSNTWGTAAQHRHKVGLALGI